MNMFFHLEVMNLIWLNELKTKFGTGFIILDLTLLFRLMSMDSKSLGYLNLFKWLQVLCYKQYDENWYINSGCSRHVIEMKEYLRDSRNLTNNGVLNFGINS